MLSFLTGRLGTLSYHDAVDAVDAVMLFVVLTLVLHYIQGQVAYVLSFISSLKWRC